MRWAGGRISAGAARRMLDPPAGCPAGSPDAPTWLQSAKSTCISPPLQVKFEGARLASQLDATPFSPLWLDFAMLARRLTRRHALATSATALLATGCRPPGKPSGAVGICFETLQTAFWEASYTILKEQLRDRNLPLMEAVADGDASRQLDQVQAFIVRRARGLIVAAKDSVTAVPLVKHANRAEVPIVFFNRRPHGDSGRYVAIQSDNFSIARDTVEHMAQVARRRGGAYQAMVLLGDLGDMNAVGRRDGFLAAIKEHQDIVRVVAQVPTDWNQEKAHAGAAAALAANPGINFVFSSSDFLFPSLISALQSANKYRTIDDPGHVILGGFDGDALAYRMLQERYLDADGVQDLYFECKASIEAVEAAHAPTEPTVVLDRGFVAHQGNLVECRERMWGARYAAA